MANRHNHSLVISNLSKNGGYWLRKKQFYGHLKLHLIFQDFTDFSAKRYPVQYTQYEKKKKKKVLWVFEFK